MRGCGACCRASASAWMQRVHCTFAMPRYIERVSRSSRFFGPRLQVEAGRRCELMLHTARSPILGLIGRCHRAGDPPMAYLILATLGVLAFGDEPAVRSARSPRAFDQGRPHIVGGDMCSRHVVIACLGILWTRCWGCTDCTKPRSLLRQETWPWRHCLQAPPEIRNRRRLCRAHASLALAPIPRCRDLPRPRHRLRPHCQI